MSETCENMVRREDKVANVMAMIGHMCTDMNQGALSASLPFIVIHYGYSYFQVAMLIFASNIASSVIQPLFGTIGDRRPTPWFMALGVFLAGFGMFGVGFASTYELTLLFAMTSGIGTAMFHPEGGRISNLAAGERKSNGMSIFAVGGNIGFFLGPILCATFLNIFGMRGTFVFLIPAGICSIALLSFNSRFKALGTARSQIQESDKVAERWKNFWLVIVVLGFRSIVQYGLLAFVPLFFVHVLGQSETIGSLALALFSITGAFATFISGKTTEKFGIFRITLICFILTALLFVAFSLNRSVIVAALIVVALSVTVDLFYPSVVALGMSYVPRHLGTASGISYGIVVCIGGVAEPILGVVGDMSGLPTTILILATISFIGLFVTYVIKIKD